MAKGFLGFLFSIWQNRYLLSQLVRRDFKSRYLGSYLGLFWAFVQPAVSIMVMWFVFTFGFKAGKVDNNVPFMLWLVLGMFPWFFISECITGASSVLLEYSYLIKKINFKPSIIPLIKIISALIIHVFFIFVSVIFCIAYGFYPDIHWLQVFYYLFSAIVLLIGIGWLTSSLTIFVKDIGQIVGVSMQIMFWATPIFWSFKMLPGKLLLLFKLNPFFYITEGYRNSFIYEQWFWNNWAWSLYYWGITMIIFFLGSIVFFKLRPHFADVV